MAQTMMTSGVMCEACNVCLHEKVFNDHINGKKHKFKQDQYDKKYKTVYVGGVSHLGPTDLEKIFMKYGTVSKVNKNKSKSFAFIQFDTQDSVEKAIKARIFAGGKKLFVRRYHDNSYRPEENNEKSRKLSETLSNTSQTEGEGPGVGVKELPVTIADPEWCSESDVVLWQARNFVSQVELSSEMYQSLSEVKSDVENIFRPLLPGCQAVVFGSCGSTLAFRNSDVDLFLRTASGELPTDFVRREAKEMYKSRLFKVIARIPMARVPIVKFEHVRTGWQGDLTANSQLGVCNSQLIRFLVSLDPRIKPLIMVIKYWAKVCGVTGSHNRFTTYSLVMLVIFYLQQLDPPMLPTIAQLQQMTQLKEYCLGWECSFCDEEWRVQSECLSKPNNLTLRELLTGFFKFYCDFDFKNVICPLLGKSIPVQEFEGEENELPPEMFLYKEKLKSDPKAKFRTNVNFRVQDPFELCLNITRNVVGKTCSVFKEGCKVSLELCEKENDSDLLKSLFSIDEESLDISGDSMTVFIDYKEHIESPEASENSFDQWFQQTTESILLVLKRIYKLNVDSYTDEVVSKVKKVEATQDVHSLINNESKKLVFVCNGKSNTWNFRKKMSKFMNSINIDLDLFEREVCISNALYNPKDNDLFYIRLIITSSEELKRERGGKGIMVHISTKKSPHPLVKGFLQSIKNELRFYVSTAQDFINKVKGSSPLTGVKESLKELFELKLENLPDLIEIKNKRFNICASKGKEETGMEDLKTTDNKRLLERKEETNYKQVVEQKCEILCPELKQKVDVENGELKNETESALTSAKVNPFLASIEKVALKAGHVEIDVSSELSKEKTVEADELNSNTERKEAKNLVSLQIDCENRELNAEAFQSENCSKKNKNSSTSSELKIEEDKVKDLEGGSNKQTDDTKLSLPRPNIHSERPMKLKKPNTNGLNRNAGQQPNHSKNGSPWQPWVGGGPPGCQPWKPNPPDQESQGNHTGGGEQESPNSIMLQKKWYPGLFRDESS